MERHRSIVVEGPIGVGKSALAQVLAEELLGRAVLDAVDENPFLPLFHEEPQRYAFQAQMAFLLARFQQHQQLLQQELFAKATVSDTLFERDRIYAALCLQPAERALHDKVYEMLAPQVKAPDLVVYLQARLDVLLARIKRAGRPFEKAIDPDFVARLCSLYNDFFFHYSATPLLVIDTSELDLSDPEAQATIVTLVRQHRGGTRHYIPRG